MLPNKLAGRPVRIVRMGFLAELWESVHQAGRWPDRDLAGLAARDMIALLEMGESLPQAGMQIQVRIAELRGYEQGDVGWADGSATFQRGRESVEVRMTAVFVREKGDWHMVQNHASIGVPNNHTFDPLFGSIPAATG
ncbi:MAG: hypothetical protein E6J32_05540 [Chloroflexi bacterium]|nr:MAG: hypothetical protein E6J32_05540 [Chloroflexota bacterium]